jgi:N,N-dimethylformamidase beta subunit-like, C-terminal
MIRLLLFHNNTIYFDVAILLYSYIIQLCRGLIVLFGKYRISILILVLGATIFLLDPSTVRGQNMDEMRIGFVENTFTNAAYNDAFYHFYPKYDSIPVGVKITSDLDKLTAVIPPLSQSKSHIYLTYLIERLKPILSNASVTILRDEDVHHGKIFLNNGSNAYDMLVLGQQEYVTHNEYDNFKRFVSNGGTIVFVNGNFFYAEVRYDEDKHTVTFVKGHNWKFDGKSASKSVIERWFNETREWVGSNFWVTPGIHGNVSFANNPFSYKHLEDQFVNNPKDKIILDYGAIFPDDKKYYRTTPTIATYELNYHKGKVIVLGIYGYRLLENDSFINFLGDLISNHPINKEFCPPTLAQRQGVNLIDQKQTWNGVNDTEVTWVCGNVLLVRVDTGDPNKLANSVVLPTWINSTDRAPVNLTLNYKQESLSGNAKFFAEIRDTSSNKILWSKFLKNINGQFANQSFTLPENILNKPVEFRLNVVTNGSGVHILTVKKANIIF